MKEHELKTLPVYFDAVKDGLKPFEVRKNDRGFQTGDTLILRKWGPLPGHSSPSRYFDDKPIRCVVTWILQGGQFGIEPGYCVMGIKQVQP